VDGAADSINHATGLRRTIFIGTDRDASTSPPNAPRNPTTVHFYESATPLILARLEVILKQLQTNPVPVRNNTHFVKLIDRSAALLKPFQDLYKPYKSIVPFFRAPVEPGERKPVTTARDSCTRTEDRLQMQKHEEEEEGYC